MWKKNPLGGYEQGTTRSSSVKEKNPIRSGWYRHPQTKQIIWYDSKTNTFRDKIAGPARETLSVGWKLSGGKDAEDLVRMTVRGAKIVIPALWEYDKARRKELGEIMDTSFDYYKKSLTNLLVSDEDPGFIDPKDTTNQVTKDTPPEQTKKPRVFKLTESKQIDYTNLHPDNEHIKVLDKQIEEKKHQMMINLGNKL